MTGNASEIDEIDRRIVACLQKEGRRSVASIAEEVALSRSATAERIKRLEREALIVGYRAEVSPKFTGLDLEAVVGIRARRDADRARLESWLASESAIVEAVHLTGNHDYLLRVRCKGPADLDRVLMAMKSDAQIAETETSIVLRSIELGSDRP